MLGKVCVRLSARHKTLSRSAPGGVAGGSVASVTTGADILIINTSPAPAVNRLENLIGAWLRLHLRDFASHVALSFASSFLSSFLFLLLSSILVNGTLLFYIREMLLFTLYFTVLIAVTAQHSFVLFLFITIKLHA